VHCIAKTFPDWKHMKHLLKENGRVRTQGNRRHPRLLYNQQLGVCSQKSMQEGGNTEKLIKIEKDGKLVRQCTTGVFTDAQSKGIHG